MEEMHKKLIDDLQQQHRTEVAALLKEKDLLLQEETAATMAGKVFTARNHRKMKALKAKGLIYFFIYCVGDIFRKCFQFLN